MDKLLVCASLVSQGKCPMDDLYALTMEYQKARDKASESKQAEKAVLGALGKGCWLTFDQVYERVKNVLDWDDVYTCICHLIAKGRIQTAVPSGMNQEYFCGLGKGSEKPDEG